MTIRGIAWGINPLTGNFTPYYTDTGEPVFCGDRLMLGWIKDENTEREQDEMGTKQSAKSLTAKEITEAIKAHYSHRLSSNKGNWALFTELRIGTGYGKDAEQRLDAWAMALWQSDHFKRITYEIKVSRTDFLSEIKNPVKRRMGLLLSNEFYFITPPDLLKVEEVPVECGLIEVHRQDDDRPMRFDKGSLSLTYGGYNLHTVIPAPHRDTPAPSLRFLATICRLAMKQERDDVQIVAVDDRGVPEIITGVE